MDLQTINSSLKGKAQACEQPQLPQASSQIKENFQPWAQYTRFINCLFKVMR